MTRLVVTLRTGEVRDIDADPAIATKDAIVRAGIDEIAQLCGGNCACGTCHVYLSPEAFAVVGGPHIDESAVLDCSLHRMPTSRLSCQIVAGTLPEGTELTIAPEY